MAYLKNIGLSSSEVIITALRLSNNRLFAFFLASGSERTHDATSHRRRDGRVRRVRQNLRRRSEALDEHHSGGDEANTAARTAPRGSSPALGRHQHGDRLPCLQGCPRQRNGGLRRPRYDVIASRDVICGRSDRADGDNAAGNARAVSGVKRVLRARGREDYGHHANLYDDDEGQDAGYRRPEEVHGRASS